MFIELVPNCGIVIVFFYVSSLRTLNRREWLDYDGIRIAATAYLELCSRN